jgi:hypothetical protein
MRSWNLDTQVISKIRPVWLIIGIGVMAFCAVVAICVAVIGVSLNMIMSSGGAATSQARLGGTLTPIATQTAFPTFAIITVSAPTRIPLPGVLPPLPFSTPVNNVPVAGLNAGDPAAAVQMYYQAVDQNRYDVTWPMLSTRFKDKFNCCAPNYNYAGYLDWWNSVDQIEFADVHTVQQSGSKAAVYMELRYHMKAGGVSVDRAYIHLVYDPVIGWLFEDKTDTL